MTLYSQSSYPQSPIVVAAAPRPSSGSAVASLVLGLVGVFVGWCMLGLPCIAAVIVGHIALADTKNGVKSGRGMAVAGLALGYLALAPAIILCFWMFLGAATGGVPAVDVTPTP